MSCRHPAWARAFRDLPLEADTVPRPSGPACRPAARPAGRSSFPPEPPCRNAALDASARNRRRVPAMAVRFGLEAWLGPAGPVRPPRQPLPSSHMRETVRVLNPCRENGLRPRRFRDAKWKPVIRQHGYPRNWSSETSSNSASFGRTSSGKFTVYLQKSLNRSAPARCSAPCAGCCGGRGRPAGRGCRGPCWPARSRRRAAACAGEP